MIRIWVDGRGSLLRNDDDMTKIEPMLHCVYCAKNITVTYNAAMAHA
jgi:hypothetical protein